VKGDAHIPAALQVAAGELENMDEMVVLLGVTTDTHGLTIYALGADDARRLAGELLDSAAVAKERT
jgi:hypothetical protein